ncbi:molybdate ABC transporter substrate-binding protein [Naumannella huperziae]
MIIATRRGVALLVAGAIASLAACGGNTGQPTTGEAGGRTLTVFAAASLKTTFTTIADDFEQANPGTTVALNFDGSANLVQQIQQGAPADVFASANTANMTKLTDAGLTAAEPVDFASNTLQIAVAPGNPLQVKGLADLADREIVTVLCAPQVPCGAASVTVEEAAGIDIAPVSEEQSVTDVLNKVASGEADAGLVYRTDVSAASDRVAGVEFPESSAAVNVYPIARVGTSGQPDLADAFIAHVTGPDGQRVLADAGFARP